MAVVCSLSLALGACRQRQPGPIKGTSPVLEARPPDAGLSASEPTHPFPLPFEPGLTPMQGGGLIFAVGASKIRVELHGEGFTGRESAVMDWIERCARAVAGYYGAFPAPVVFIDVREARGSDIRGGQTFPGSPPRIAINVGTRASASAFERNWSMTHEMVHLAFPDVPPAHQWIEEGLATFVEPIARARAGWITEEAVWAEWIDNMPLGLPGPRDGGLDGTTDWGRTYWGGALFCLVSAVALLERTGGRHGLDSALRGIVAAGGTISARWSILQALRAGDAATGTSVLGDNYAAMKDTPVRVDLDALWRRLGVLRAAGSIRYDDTAPLASVRRALVAGPR